MLPLTPTTSGREENGNQATSAGSPLLAMTNTNLVLFAGYATAVCWKKERSLLRHPVPFLRTLLFAQVSLINVWFRYSIASLDSAD